MRWEEFDWDKFVKEEMDGYGGNNCFSHYKVWDYIKWYDNYSWLNINIAAGMVEGCKHIPIYIGLHGWQYSGTIGLTVH